MQRTGAKTVPPLWLVMILAAMAGGLGWGIRGQYGHETGAMIAGALVGSVLLLAISPGIPVLHAVRAVALCTVAMGLGGSMTYGQTIGLTQDAPLVGNWLALGWGMLGLAIKGGIWIGFAGVFLGIGLGGKQYRSGELLLVMFGLAGLSLLGIWMLNSPFDPENKRLPLIYFSDSWRWEPEAVLKPRPEVWGGLAFALTGLIAYAHFFRQDILASRMGFWGILGGAIGFPLGQSLQAFHAWNIDLFRAGVWARIDPLINWWNFMETTFGAVMGAILGLGLWLNRTRIAVPEPSVMSLRPWVGTTLLFAHVSLLLMVEFADISIVNSIYDFGLFLGLIPVVAVVGSRFWPYFVIFPVTLLPIAGKTIRRLVYEEAVIPPFIGWALYFVLPLSVAIILMLRGIREAGAATEARAFLARVLLFLTWIYFLLNFAFFRFPWPWETWTVRTPNALIFSLCVFGLTAFAIQNQRGQSPAGLR